MDSKNAAVTIVSLLFLCSVTTGLQTILVNANPIVLQSGEITIQLPKNITYNQNYVPVTFSYSITNSITPAGSDIFWEASVSYVLDGNEGTLYNYVLRNPNARSALLELNENITDIPDGNHTIKFYVKATPDGHFTNFVASSKTITFATSTASPTQTKPASTHENSWEAMAPLPSPLSHARAAVINDTIYVIGTHSTPAGDVNVNYQHNPSTNTWQSRTPSPNNRTGAAIVACKDKIYVVGGWFRNEQGYATFSNLTELYDPATDSWQTKASMPSSLDRPQASLVNGKIYVMSGTIGGALGNFGAVNSNYAYDPERDSWQTKAPIPTAVFSAAHVVLDDKIYVIGGATVYLNFFRAGGHYETTNLTQIYDPSKNQWSQGTPVPLKVMSAAGAATSGLYAPKQIYVFGGGIYDESNDLMIVKTLIYNPQTGNWSTGAPMRSVRTGSTVANVNDALYVIGGYSKPDYVSANEKYIPIGYVPPPSPTPIPSPSQTSSPTQQPTLEPSLTLTPRTGDLSGVNTLRDMFWITIAVVIAIAVLAYFYFKKRRG